jgi:hypothetical protein
MNWEHPFGCFHLGTAADIIPITKTCHEMNKDIVEPVGILTARSWAHVIHITRRHSKSYTPLGVQPYQLEWIMIWRTLFHVAINAFNDSRAFNCLHCRILNVVKWDSWKARKMVLGRKRAVKLDKDRTQGQESIELYWSITQLSKWYSETSLLLKTWGSREHERCGKRAESWLF